ncbi:HEAT repeat domain-containing protein [Streptomyces sp. NBC_00536]|uniref:HEAT repeat domain-containing protein n=1 Tax=Streptomyces sp. NBC_00536 TaxID=2975769 RepID=UPI002E81F449|nr:HEAT repeat domain-containing protein [Streptomyces sp. NBC_00536]WUC82866.1 HEAT repeat domain-containing protein [Streptomyces sp. NBC_00536]
MDVGENEPYEPNGTSTDELFVRALAEVRADAGPAPALLALHARPTREVFGRAARLLAHDEPEERELGAQILRELGPRDDDGRRPFTRETIAVVLAELPSEPDPGVLGWLISVLGYHIAEETLDLVLGHLSHPAQPVRFSVAAALPRLADPDRTQDRVVDALLRLSEDEDADVRWYAVYALFHETAGVADADRVAWATDLTTRGDPERRDALRHLGTTLDDDADPALRAALQGGAPDPASRPA